MNTHTNTVFFFFTVQYLKVARTEGWTASFCVVKTATSQLWVPLNPSEPKWESKREGGRNREGGMSRDLWAADFLSALSWGKDKKKGGRGGASQMEEKKTTTPHIGWKKAGESGKRKEKTSMKIWGCHKWWQILTHKYTDTHILTSPTEQTSGPEWIMGN